jgi:hypothetical protein
MPAELLDQWTEYFRLEPHGSQVDDVRFGALTATLAAVNRVKIDPQALYSWQRKKLEQPDPGVRALQWRAYCAAYPGTVYAKN